MDVETRWILPGHLKQETIGMQGLGGHGERGHQSLCQGLRHEGSWRGAVLGGGHNGDGEEPEGSTKALVEDVIR